MAENDEPQDRSRSDSNELGNLGNSGMNDLSNSNNELGNLESDFQSGANGVDDLAGDIINPMEEAEYYQGSFQDDNHLPEYKS